MTSLRKLLAACSVSIEFADQEKCRASPERSQGKRERPSRCQSEAWVQANFKETQLTNMRVCDTADVRVDTFPGRVFRRKVEQLSPASGSQFALLPPDNATGNFTWLRNNGADQGLPNCCYRRNHARVSNTSIFPRVALEYGHTWWAWCTNSSAMALSMPGR